MLYRCRWCERGYCEDCLDWDKTELLGESLKEYEILGFPPVVQAYYIKCPGCTAHHTQDNKARIFCRRRAEEIDDEYNEFLKQQSLKEAAARVINTPKKSPGSTGYLTEAPTLDSSGITTPGVAPDKTTSSAGLKRKREPEREYAIQEQPSKKGQAFQSPVIDTFEDTMI